MRGLGINSFLGLLEASLILQSARHPIHRCAKNRSVFMKCYVIVKPNVYRPLVNLAGELREDLRSSGVVLHLSVDQSSKLAHLFNLVMQEAKDANTWDGISKS